MAVDVEARRRLGKLVSERRQEISLSVSAAARGAGLDRGTWTGVESGSRQTEEYNYSRVERVLGWQAGSIKAVLKGGNPTELAANLTEDHTGGQARQKPKPQLDAGRLPDEEDLADAYKLVLDDPALTEEERDEFVRIIRADWEHERAEARRRLRDRTALRVAERKRGRGVA